MREKVKELIYLDTNRYISIDSLRIFYWAIIIIPLIMVVFGIAAINTIGVNWRSLFPLISIGIWSLLYWTFVLTVQGRKTKTFELRFLVNGISGLLISSLFWILYASLSLLENAPVIGFDFLLWISLFYLLFSILYIGLVILGVHKGVFKKIKEKSQTPKLWQFQLSLPLFFQVQAQWVCILPEYLERTQVLQCRISLEPLHLFGLSFCRYWRILISSNIFIAKSMESCAMKMVIRHPLTLSVREKQRKSK